MLVKKRAYQKKIKLAMHGRRVKWAPVWAVLRKHGQGKKIHPSRMTRIKRSWRSTKLKIKPRRVKKQFIG